MSHFQVSTDNADGTHKATVSATWILMVFWRPRDLEISTVQTPCNIGNRQDRRMMLLTSERRDAELRLRAHNRRRGRLYTMSVAIHPYYSE